MMVFMACWYFGMVQVGRIRGWRFFQECLTVEPKHNWAAQEYFVLGTRCKVLSLRLESRVGMDSLRNDHAIEQRFGYCLAP